MINNTIIYSSSKREINYPVWNNTNLTYTGNTLTATFDNYDTSEMVGTNLTGINAGNYTAIFTP